ncbi:hypothetical protein [Hyalangium rubrum]|uniref:Transposase n=1 Tax=Hyalangium rubrum TaxID=3103134 RepID=A0ABU5H4L9_9BACT|nr:hypothetical protein [Hyalangium sp. s54d21]MDY7228408.1 hypothetical protein [Hyalangium sp. s54d21]
MRRTRKDWWHSVSRRTDDLLVQLFKADTPYTEIKRAMLAQAEEFKQEARTPAERLHVDRLAMQLIITQAYASGAGWEEFGPLLRRCQRLGYADITHRINVACLYVQSLPRFPEKARRAFAMLDAVEQTLKRIRKSHYLRREGMLGIAHARGVAASVGLKR